VGGKRGKCVTLDNKEKTQMFKCNQNRTIHFDKYNISNKIYAYYKYVEHSAEDQYTLTALMTYLIRYTVMGFADEHVTSTQVAHTSYNINRF